MSLRGILDNHKRVSIVPVVHAVPGREATGEKEQRIVAFQGGWHFTSTGLPDSASGVA